MWSLDRLTDAHVWVLFEIYTCLIFSSPPSIHRNIIIKGVCSDVCFKLFSWLWLCLFNWTGLWKALFLVFSVDFLLYSYRSVRLILKTYFHYYFLNFLWFFIFRIISQHQKLVEQLINTIRRKIATLHSMLETYLIPLHKWFKKLLMISELSLLEWIWLNRTYCWHKTHFHCQINFSLSRCFKIVYHILEI